jgi:hypothetical protein
VLERREDCLSCGLAASSLRRGNGQRQFRVSVFKIKPHAADVAALILACNQLS